MSKHPDLSASGDAYLISFRTPRPPIPLQHPHHTLGHKIAMQRLIPPTEQYPVHPIEFFESYWWRRIERDQTDDGRLDLRRGPEIVLADVHHIVDFGVELHIGRQTGPELGPRASDEPQGELALEHEDGGAEERAVREEAEDEWRGDLVWRVGDADVKVGQRRFDKVADDEVEFALLGSWVMS